MTEPSAYLPFANPAFAPDWPSRTDPERPAWPLSAKDAPAFAAYCARQLDELDRRVQAAASPTPRQRAILDQLWDATAEERHHHAWFLEQIGMGPDEFERRRRRVDEITETGAIRSGPTVGAPSDRANLPAARAAADMAKLRFVIYPRFWDRKQLTRPAAEEIAAPRYGCKPREAASWYENERIARNWRDAAKMINFK